MISLSFISLLDDWNDSYFKSDYSNEFFKFWNPILNIHFFTSLFFVTAFASIVFVHRKKTLPEPDAKANKLYFIFDYIFPGLLAFFVYFTFCNELNAIFTSKFQQSYVRVPSKEISPEYGSFIEIYDYSWLKLSSVANIIYSTLFFLILTVFAIKKWNSNLVRWTTFGSNIIFSIIFLFYLSILTDLRSSYLNGTITDYYPAERYFIYLRYICFACFGLLLFLTNNLLKTDTFSKTKLSPMFIGCIVHFFILVILSNELININILSNSGQNELYNQGTKAAYKLGFTTLWGIYSFALIAWGMYKRNRIMRISAISLFGITLIKLVTFDTWDLSTGYKIIAYILLGVILLIVAFLYQKFKVLIFDEEAVPESGLQN
jgi:hypothetical protein